MRGRRTRPRRDDFEAPVDPWMDPKDLLREQPGSIEHVVIMLGFDTGRESGDELEVRCQMHGYDRRPSMRVNTSTGQWKCFACDAGGSLARLAAVASGMRMPDAWRWVAPALGEPVTGREVTYLHLDTDEFIQLPYVPESALADRGISTVAADELDIRWDDEWYNPETGAVEEAFMLPAWHPSTLELIGWQWKPHAGRAHTYRGTRTGMTLFGISKIADDLPLILVESPLDVAVLRTAGEENGVASFGRDVSLQQRILLGDIARRGRKQLLLALDDDDAGWSAHDKLVTSTELRGVKKRTFNYRAATEGMSADEHAKDVGELDDWQIIAGIRASLPSKPGLRADAGRCKR